jgi:hypothetical protein
MKKVCCLLLMACVLVACGGGSSGTESPGGNSPSVTLQQDETVTGEIAQVGEVDWYEFDAVETQRTLTVSCNSTYTDSPVDFMLTVYEKDEETGNLETVFGKSAPEDAYAAADLQIHVGVDRPRHLYFAVRDFKDDEASQQVKYRIKVSYSDEPTQNSSFADAIVLNAGAGQVCHTGETIFPIGDVDCYRFNIATAGVYRITSQFNVSQSMTMPVNLGLELYDETGQNVYSFKGQRPADNLYVVLAQLASGAYYLVVDDQGRDDQSQYDYSVCIEPVAAEEVLGNDTQESAESRAEGTEGYVLDGSLEYLQDEDWYVIPIPAATGVTSQNLRINLSSAFGAIPEALQGQTDPGSYRIEIRDADNNLLHAYDQPVTATDPYVVEFAAGQGQQHTIMVKPVFSQQMLMALPYQLRVQLAEVSDPGEQNDPRTLDPNGETVTGKIYKLGDKDDYYITVDTADGSKVLELSFDTTQASEVAYNLHVMWDGEHKILKDINGTADGTSFKASYYLAKPTDPGASTSTMFHLQVCDDQNNDGDNVEYTLKASVLGIPGQGQVSPQGTEPTSAVYFDEPGERADTNAADVTVIEYDNYNQPEFKANTTLLRVDELDTNNQWHSDWVKGFADYDGDRDIFELNFDDVTASQEVWYFDIQVRMLAIGSDVEYCWALFRDANPLNNRLLERTFWEDPDGQILQYDDNAEGVIALWGDVDLSIQNYDETIPTGTDRFWLGHAWSGSKYYLSIQDFNKVLLDRVWNDALERWDPVPNQTPDNDWGNTNSTPTVRPYYFQVTVTYHPGCSHPDDTSTECTQ